MPVGRGGLRTGIMYSKSLPIYHKNWDHSLAHITNKRPGSDRLTNGRLDGFGRWERKSWVFKIWSGRLWFISARFCSTHIFSPSMINEDFLCSLKKGPTPAQRARFVFRYVAYWRVNMKNEKIDPTALLSRKGDVDRRRPNNTISWQLNQCFPYVCWITTGHVPSSMANILDNRRVFERGATQLRSRFKWMGRIWRELFVRENDFLNGLSSLENHRACRSVGSRRMTEKDLADTKQFRIHFFFLPKNTAKDLMSSIRKPILTVTLHGWIKFFFFFF
jgi:hypothetical protein